MSNDTRKIDKEQMKRFNRQMVFQEIHRSGSISRSGLAQLTGLTLMSVGRIADELIRSGLLAEEEGELLDEDAVRTVGRRPRLLKIVADRMLNLGLELDRNRIQAGVMDLNGRIFVRIEQEENLSQYSPEQTAELCAQLIAQLHQKTELLLGKELEPFDTLGVVCPGVVDSKRGIVHFSSQLQWENVDFVSLLKTSTGIQNIQLDNEVKSRGQAEAILGAGRNMKRVALLNIGSGVGSCLVIGRKVYRGRDNMAGELGHICIDPEGNQCECGQRGCLQTCVSDLALMQEVKKYQPDGTLESLFQSYTEGEDWAAAVMDRAVYYAVMALEMIHNLYAPNITVLCGDLIESYPAFQQAVIQKYRSQKSRYASGMELVVSEFGRDGNLTGAGSLALNLNLDIKS